MKFQLILSLILLTSCKHPIIPVVAASFAKEYCSCRFVVGQTEKYCKSYASQIVSVSSFSEDLNNKYVSAAAFGHLASSQFINKKYGCDLIIEKF